MAILLPNIKYFVPILVIFVLFNGIFTLSRGTFLLTASAPHAMDHFVPDQASAQPDSLIRPTVSLKKLNPLLEHFFNGSILVHQLAPSAKAFVQLQQLKSEQIVYVSREEPSLSRSSQVKIVDINFEIPSVDAVLLGSPSLTELCSNFTVRNSTLQTIITYLNKMEYTTHWILFHDGTQNPFHENVGHPFQCKEALDAVSEAVDTFLEHHIEWNVAMEPIDYGGGNFSSSFFLFKRMHNPTLARIQELQFPPNCRDRPSEPYPLFLLQTYRNFGFGSFIHHCFYGLQLAYVYNRTAVFIGDWRKYGDASIRWCPDKEPSPQCYFFQYSNCTGMDALMVYRESVNDSTANFWRRSAWQQDYRSSTDVAVYVPDDILMFVGEYKEPLMRQLITWGAGSFTDLALGADAQTYPFLHILLRQRRWVREIVQQRIHMIQQRLGDHYVGMHVRHGDKWTQNPIMPLHTFMNHLRKAREKKDIPSTVFLATDDQEVILESQNYTDFTFVYLNLPRSMGKTFSMLNEEQLRNRTEMVISLLMEIELLVHSDFFVGSEHSHFTRLVFRMFYYFKRMKDGIPTGAYSFNQSVLINEFM